MFEPDIKVLTEEEKQEKRRQESLLGVKLNNKRFYCSQKMAAGFKIFFHGREKFGKLGQEDGKDYIQIYTLNQEILSTLANRSADAAFHKFLSKCYDTVCEIHEKRLKAAAKALEADQDNSKRCQTEVEDLQKEQTCRSSDILLLQQQKTKKPQPPFDKGDLKTWCSLPAEDADRSKNDLTANKTGGLIKADDLEKQIQKFTTEVEVFQKKVDALKPELEAAEDEKQYKDIRLTFDYNQLQIEKIQKKVEKLEEQKAGVQSELEGVEKQIEILECVLDSHQLIKDAENWQNRNERAVERVSKVIKDRDALDTMRINLNKRWNDLTKEEELPKKRITVFGQDKPIKPEELCEALCLKASAEVYFI